MSFSIMPAVRAKEVEQPIALLEISQVSQLKTPMPIPTA
jgi:hypothetical protein